MKLKIWTNPEEHKDEPEDQLFLRLGSCPKHGDIYLGTCDKNGNELKGGTILVVDLDLKGLILLEGVKDDLNLKTDLDGTVLTISEEEMRARHSHDLKVHVMGQIMSGIEEQQKKQASTH